jgi:hypothetical protein
LLLLEHFLSHYTPNFNIDNMIDMLSGHYYLYWLTYNYVHGSFPSVHTILPLLAFYSIVDYWYFICAWSLQLWLFRGSASWVTCLRWLNYWPQKFPWKINSFFFFFSFFFVMAREIFVFICTLPC